jgi:oligosaccharide repeat unit polymerase
MTILPLVLLVVAATSVALLPPLHPAQIWAVVWALGVGAYSLRLLPYITLDPLAQVLIASALLAFTGGTLIGARLGGRSRLLSGTHERTTHQTDVRLAALVVLAATLVGLLAFLVQAARAYGLHAALVTSPAVRLAVQTGTFHITIKYIYAAVAASALCGLCAANGTHRRRWALASALAVLSTYFATGRSTVVVAAVTALSAYVLARPDLPSKRLFIGGGTIVALVAVGIFTLGGSFIGKTFPNSELATFANPFVRDSLPRSTALPYEYLSAPIAAFGAEVSVAGHLPRLGGCASFGYVCKILHHTGLDTPSIPEVRPFTAAPLQWNTYTSLDAPLLDGGPWLIFPVVAFAGFLLGAAWRAARTKTTLGILCYAILVPCVLTAAGSNNFTAPFLVGAALIVFATVLLARVTIRMRSGEQ